MASRSKFAAFILSTALVAAIAGSASSAIDITKAAAPVAPSFRGSANTTWFGWAAGSFDGATADHRIDNPAPTIGTTTAGVGFVQNDPTVSILTATSGNIYSGENNLDVTITAPTTGSVGTGFATIIVQGKTAGGPFGSDLTFSTVSGAVASQTVGTNAAGSSQFFVKYDIPGNAASYPITLTGGAHNSINNLQVDTLWSATGYAADFAVTPEPMSIAAIGSLVIGSATRRRRSI